MEDLLKFLSDQFQQFREWLRQIVAHLGDLLSDPKSRDDILVNLIAWVISAMTLLLIRHTPRKVMHFFKRRHEPTVGMDFGEYKSFLTKKTLLRRHPWMRENQTLSDILVPAIVTYAGMAEYSDFEKVVEMAFSESGSRFILIGTPGSGKSVALSIAANRCWEILQDDGMPMFIPVLMTFDDFQNCGYSLERTITESLLAGGLSKTEITLTESVTNWLLKGKCLVLMDGLDELNSDSRNKAVSSLRKSLERFKASPAMITCRENVFGEHAAQFSDLSPIVIRIGEFLPSTIERFINKWHFDPPKSRLELQNILRERPPLREIAKNPLMLTILTFVYSKTKVRLPSYKAQFLEDCTRALLEEWDHAKATERSNRFDRPHKEDLLANLAFLHLSGNDPEADLDVEFVRQYFASQMREMGLVSGENIKMLKEIAQNSGLLESTRSEQGLHFCRRLFLEYFAALYFLKNPQADPLQHYLNDTMRWYEVLLLFCSLNTNAKVTASIVEQILASGDVELSLELVAHASAITPGVSNKVLDAIEQIALNHPTQRIIASLGHLAANHHSSSATSAYHILLNALRSAIEKQGFSDEVLPSLLTALMGVPGEREVGLLVENLERLKLQQILPVVDEGALFLISKLMSVESLSATKKKEWIESLRLANKPRLLYEIVLNSEDKSTIHDTFVALARLSNRSSFWQFLDNPGLPERSGEVFPSFEVETSWGWPHPFPRTGIGRKIAICVANHMAIDMLSKGSSAFMSPKPDLHGWLSYLAHGIAYRSKYPTIKKAQTSELRGKVSQIQASMAASMPNLVFSVWKNARKSRKWFRTTGSSGWRKWSTVLFFNYPLLIGWSLLEISKCVSGQSVWEMNCAFFIIFFSLNFCFVVFSIGIYLKLLKKLDWPSLVAALIAGPWLAFGLAAEELRKQGKSYKPIVAPHACWFLTWVIFTFVAPGTAFKFLLGLQAIPAILSLNIAYEATPFLPNTLSCSLTEYLFSQDLPKD